MILEKNPIIFSKAIINLLIQYQNRCDDIIKDNKNEEDGLKNIQNKSTLIDKKGKIFLFLVILDIFLLFGLFPFIYVSVPYWSYVDNYLSEIIDFNIGISYLAFLSLLWLIFVVFCMISLIYYIMKLRRKNKIKPNYLIIGINIMIILICGLFFYLISNIRGDYLSLVLRIISNYLFLYILLINILLIPMYYFIFIFYNQANQKLMELKRKDKNKRNKRNNRKKSTIIYSFELIFLLGLVIIPNIYLFIAKPTVINWDLPPKPLVVAHRGASYYSPENTLIAGELAHEFGAVGWEIDVMISIDGVPFLLHDATFKRTTNIKEIFPNRMNEHASWFTINEIRSLNAGSWYVNEDPNSLILQNQISNGLIEQYMVQKIPTLQEVVNLTIKYNMILDLEIKSIPASHPYESNISEIVFGILNNSTIGKNAWVYSNSPLTENFTRGRGGYMKPDFFKLTNYNFINLASSVNLDYIYNSYINNVTTLIYTIDDKAQFSKFWAYGTTLIKTNKPKEMVDLKYPILVFNPIQYYSIIIGIICIYITLNYLLISKRLKRIETGIKR